MPRTFKDTLEDDLDKVFLNTNEFAVSVSISRGEYAPTTNVPALVATKQDNASARTTDRMSLKFEERHYRIRTSAYVVNGEETLPLEGDKLGETLRSGVAITCEVLRTKDRPCYELDSFGTFLLVHTKRI